MVSFPDGTRVWIMDARGKPLEEWAEEVVIDEEAKTHIRTVYVATLPGEDFAVGYSVTPPSAGDLRMSEVSVDGVCANGYCIDPPFYYKELKCEGWVIGSTVRCFAFGKVDTDEECNAGSTSEQRAAMDKARISFDYFDAVYTGPLRIAARPFDVPPPDVEAVNPDSKIATIVKAQIKTGSTKASAPKSYALRTSMQRYGSIKYTARFLYRPQGFLVGNKLMPDPNPAGSRQSEEAEDEAESSAVAAKKRKRQDVAAAGGKESAEDRKKRLRAELLAIKKELGEDDAAPLQPGLNLGNGAVKVKPEPVLDPSRPQNEKIFFDLSADTDSDSDA